MKRFISLLILLFMVVSLVIPILDVNSKESTQNNIVESVFSSDITYELVFEEAVEEQDPYEIAIQEMQEKMKEINSIEDNKEWFLAYKDIVFEYAEWIDPPETIYDYFTDNEIYLIQRVVETETYDQDFISKCNVASVIINRFESGKYGDSIESIITAPNQFSYWRKDITENTILAVEYAFQIEDTTNGCIAFRSDDNPNAWYSWHYVYTDKAGHHFYME